LICKLPGILVYDLQRLLARYEQRPDAEDKFVDVISGTSTNQFLDHLHAVYSRLSPGNRLADSPLLGNVFTADE
jgi:hypothetical protein